MKKIVNQLSQRLFGITAYRAKKDIVITGVHHVETPQGYPEENGLYNVIMNHYISTGSRFHKQIAEKQKL